MEQKLHTLLHWINKSDANKSKNKNKNTIVILSENFQNPIAKIIERDKIDTPNTQIHDRSLSCLGTGTSIKSGRVKLILWAQASPLAE